MIYAGTYGRGIFRCETFEVVGYDEPVIGNNTVSQISIYPNPVVSSATVAFDLDKNSNVEMNIYDIQGRVVKTVSRKNLKSGHQTLSVNVNDLNKGTYIVRLVAGSKSATSKFVIIK
jgi:flagellar hook assembly protein FlgD